MADEKSLAEQIREAKQEMNSWPEWKKDAVQLEGRVPFGNSSNRNSSQAGSNLDAGQRRKAK